MGLVVHPDDPHTGQTHVPIMLFWEKSAWSHGHQSPEIGFSKQRVEIPGAQNPSPIPQIDDIISQINFPQARNERITLLESISIGSYQGTQSAQKHKGGKENDIK